MTGPNQSNHRDRSDPDRPLAVVIGGARRVGRSICIALAQRGFDVLLTFRTGEADAQATCRACQSVGAWARSEQLDLSNVHYVEAYSKSLAGDLSEVDVLVFCAGLYEPTPWGSVTVESMNAHSLINVTSPILMTQILEPALRRSNGSIVLFGDIHASQRPRKGYLAYALSKSAVEASVRLLARELAPEVRVNGIAPGVIAWPENVPESERSTYERRIPLARPGTPEDAAALVVFLACDAPYITGEIISLDGGRSLT